jgi:hypothetical protein
VTPTEALSSDARVLAPGKGVSARAPFPRRLELRCHDVHPLACAEVWRSSDAEQLIDSARAHGASAHGFTPVWYSRERVAAMTGAITGG